MFEQPGGPPPYVPYTPAAQPKTDGKAIAAMILGICSVLFCSTALIGLICAVIALIFVRQNKKERPDGLGANKGFLTAGKVCGVVGLILSILALLSYVALIVGTVALLGEYGTEFAGAMGDLIENIPEGSIDVYTPGSGVHIGSSSAF